MNISTLKKISNALDHYSIRSELLNANISMTEDDAAVKVTISFPKETLKDED